MKRLLQHRKGVIVLLVALCFGMGTAYAYNFSATYSTGQTLYFNITDATNHYVEITYPGTLSSPWDGFTKPTGYLALPSTVTNGGVTYTVTAIGTRAFYSCGGLSGGLIIPNTITTIGAQAFWMCNLTGSLTIPASVTTIEIGAFTYCNFSGSLIIPGSVTSIGACAFMSNSELTSLTIPASVTLIGDVAFAGCTGLTSLTVLPETPPSFGEELGTFPNEDAFSYVPTDIPVYIPNGSLAAYQSASGWSAFTNMQCLETLTVYDGTATSRRIPAYIYWFDAYTRSQFVIPAANLVEMVGRPIRSMTFYTTSSNIPYTTVSYADAYLIEVDYTNISAFEPENSAVYRGCFSIVNTGNGGEMTIHFDRPYTYQGGNLLVGIENFDRSEGKQISFFGQTVDGASISDYNLNSLSAVEPTQQDFIPKTTFGYVLSPCAPKSLPYTYSFEEEDEFGCWTMLNCDASTERTEAVSWSPAHQGDYIFQFSGYHTNPPQYLISPEFDGTMGMNVSFYYKNYSGTYPQTFQVGYSTTNMSPGAFTWGEEVTANDQNTWMLYEDFFPVGTKYVAVKYNHDQSWLLLDDFSFLPAMCAPKSLPYTYGFEEEAEFDCWTMLDCTPTNTGRFEAEYSYPAYQGDYFFRFFYNTNPPQYLISPKFEGNAPMKVSFYYRNVSNTYPETFQVGYSSTAPSPDAFTWDAEVTANDENNWMLYTNIFPEGTKYVAVKLNSYDQDVLFLDDFSFTPVFCPLEDQCELTFRLTDSYGDTWNGNAINVIDVAANTVLASMTNDYNNYQATGASGSFTQTKTLTVCDGRELRFEWVAGNWPGECSYTVTDFSGNEIFSGSGVMSDPVTYTVDCGKQNISLSGGDWHLIALPVPSIDPEDISNMTVGEYDFYRFDPSATDVEWQNYKNRTFRLQSGEGYLYAHGTDITLVFNGSSYLDTEPVEVPLFYDANDSHKCWNLVGNPFACEATLDRDCYVLNDEGTGIDPESLPAGTTIPPYTAVFVKAIGVDDTVVFTKVTP